jgi:hypothetical protein
MQNSHLPQTYITPLIYLIKSNQLEPTDKKAAETKKAVG